MWARACVRECLCVYVCAYLQDVGDGLQQLQQLGVPVIGDAALLGEVVVVGGDELVDGQQAGGLALQQVDHLPAELDQLGVPHRALGPLDPRLWGRRAMGGRGVSLTGVVKVNPRL